MSELILLLYFNVLNLLASLNKSLHNHILYCQSNISLFIRQPRPPLQLTTW